MLSKEDFYSNEVIDAIQIGDNSVDIVGYVTKMNNNSHSDSASKFQKFVVNNAKGREVQVVAWNNKMKILEPIVIGKIVYIGSVRASAIKNPEYNSGNVKFELQIKENSTVEVYDYYVQDSNDVLPENISILDAYNAESLGKAVKIDAIIKTAPSLYKFKNHSYFVASLTDCNYFLEMKINFDCSTMPLLKGTSVEVSGHIEEFAPGPPVLTVEKAEDINIIHDRERASFLDVINGYQTKQS